MNHREISQRSVLLHKAVAEKLLSEPDLLNTAFSNLDKLPPYYKAKWEKILQLPLSELAETIVDEGEDVEMLRQCSPFAGILSPRERWKIYEAE